MGDDARLANLRESYRNKRLASISQLVQWAKEGGTNVEERPEAIRQSEADAEAARSDLQEFCVASGRDLRLIDAVDREIDEEVSNWFK